mgnify:CR=1 FL=1
MKKPSVSSAESGSPADIEPDKRWLGTLLCCLSALTTTVFIVLLATALIPNDDRDIARGDNPELGVLAPGNEPVVD